MASPSSGSLRDLAHRLYFRSYEARRVEYALAGRAAAGASRPLRWIAVIHTIACGMLAILLRFKLARGDGEADAVMAVQVLSTVASWGLWTWSFSSPLPAALVGLLLLISTVMANDAMGSGRVVNQLGFEVGAGLRLVTIGLLVKAIYSGWRQRALELDLDLEIGEKRPRTRAILSPILLYLALLSIVVIPISLAVESDLTIGDLLDVHKLMAIVVVTWAIGCWRDTWGVIWHVAELKWFVAAIGFGLMTFSVASVYGDSLSYFSSLPQARLSEGFLDAGYSWWAILGMVAVFPAVFEELAFRGIIVPQLKRVLRTNETIAVSAIMFVILHLSILSAPHLLLVGGLTGYLRLRSKSIWPCVLLHFTHNAMCLGFEKWM